MIKHILLICSAILIYEFIKFVKFADIIKSNLKLLKKMISLFKSKYVSDLRKEKLILNYSKSLLLVSLKIFFILICIVVIMFFKLSIKFIFKFSNFSNGYNRNNFSFINLS